MISLPLTVVGLVVLFVVLVIAALRLPRWLVNRSLGGATISPAERLSAENEVQRGVFEAAAVLVAAIAFVFTVGEVRITQDQLALQRDTQQRERFAAAVEQVGSDNATVQTAGIFAMEAIATADPAYRPVLDQTLAAYLRTSAACDPPRGLPCVPRAAGADPAVQSAVTVLGRGDPTQVGRSLDLGRVNLSHLDMSGGTFTGVSFVGSNMSFADITGADLRGADMSLARQESIRGREDAVFDDTTIWP